MAALVPYLIKLPVTPHSHTHSRPWWKAAPSRLNVAPYFTDENGDSLTYTAESSDTARVTVSVTGSELSLAGAATGAGTGVVTVTARAAHAETPLRERADRGLNRCGRSAGAIQAPRGAGDGAATGDSPRGGNRDRRPRAAIMPAGYDGAVPARNG